jgi:hypothetical protein
MTETVIVKKVWQMGKWKFFDKNGEIVKRLRIVERGGTIFVER